MAVIGIIYKKIDTFFLKFKKLSPFLSLSLKPTSFHQKRARVPNVNDTEIYIQNFMVSCNIIISSAYAHYSIFKEDRLDFGISKFQRQSTYEKSAYLNSFCTF